jgi:hypothetical protein
MKEDDEGIPFHTLLTIGTHRSDRILWRKMQRRVCSVPERLLLFLVVLDMQGWAGAVLEEGAVQEGVQGARRSGRRHWTGLAHVMQKDGILVVAVLQRRRRMQEGERTRQKRWAGVQAHRGSRERENGAGAALGAAGGARRRGKTRAGATCGAAGETHARRWLRMGARGGGGEKYEQGRCGLGLRENL